MLLWWGIVVNDFVHDIIVNNIMENRDSDLISRAPVWLLTQSLTEPIFRTVRGSRTRNNELAPDCLRSVVKWISPQMGRLNMNKQRGTMGRESIYTQVLSGPCEILVCLTPCVLHGSVGWAAVVGYNVLSLSCNACYCKWFTNTAIWVKSFQDEDAHAFVVRIIG